MRKICLNVTLIVFVMVLGNRIYSSESKNNITGIAPSDPKVNTIGLPQVETDNYESKEYIDFLFKQSMLYQSSILAKEISGNGIQWRHSYFTPQPEKVVKKASVWFDCYPDSMIGKSDQNILEFLSDSDLWKYFQEIGIKALHTGPMDVSGGIVKDHYTESVDGGFDPIMYKISPQYGTEQQYKDMVSMASKHDAIIIGDVVPGHTGKGADFLLALRNYKNYTGIYDVIEIDKKDWHLLPDVLNEWETVNLSPETVDILHKKGYIPGRLQNVRFNFPGLNIEVTGWDATDSIKGVDGIVRRWVYLHYYRPGQPSLNWLDPTFSAERIISGAIIKSMHILGNKMVRLDANAYLGIEPVSDLNTTFSDATPLSIQASDFMAMFARKIGGWTYQEVEQPLDTMKSFMKNGPDISIDFITRTGQTCAAYTGDARLLNLQLREMLKAGINSSALLHCLQTHDSFGLGMPELTKHFKEEYNYGNEKLIAEMIIKQVHEKMKNQMPYIRNMGDSICTTYCGLLASRFRVKDLDRITKEQSDKILQGMILSSVYSVMQPGIVMVTGWDLVGALPLSENQIKKYLEDGDYRWLNRGAYDLIGYGKNINVSKEGIIKAKSIFGSIPEQLKKTDSYVSQLKHMFIVRDKYRIAEGKMLFIPVVDNDTVTIMIFELPENKGYIVTALNFGDLKIREKLKNREVNNLKFSLSGTVITNILTNKTDSVINNSSELIIELEPLEAKVLFVPKPYR